MKDAHLHLTDHRINAKDAIAKSKIVGLDSFISCTTQPTEWSVLESIVKEYPEVSGFLGIHPWYIDSFTNRSVSDLESLLKKKVNAGIGEIGLDRLKPDYDKQLSVFIAQLELAIKYHRSVVIHSVKAQQDILSILKRRKKNLPTVMLHGFGGPINYIKPFSEIGCYFSISPLILRKNSEKIKELLSSIPMDRLLFESDAPDVLLTPSQLTDFINSVANITGITYEKLEQVTNTNFERFLSW